MALANQEAGRLKHDYLAPAHIMLGLIAEGHCVATEALRVLDVNLDRVRDEVASQLGQGESGGGVGLRAQTDATKKAIAKAVDEARKLGHRYVGTEHLVLALLDCSESIPSKVLRGQGVDADPLREKILAMLRTSADADHDLAHGAFEPMEPVKHGLHGIVALGRSERLAHSWVLQYGTRSVQIGVDRSKSPQIA